LRLSRPAESVRYDERRSAEPRCAANAHAAQELPDHAALHQHGPADGPGRRSAARPRRVEGAEGRGRVRQPIVPCRTSSDSIVSFTRSFRPHNHLPTGAQTMPRHNVSPIDSAMYAEGFEIAEHHNLAWKEETERVRTIRGQVLSEMFEVEAKIDYAIG